MNREKLTQGKTKISTCSRIGTTACPPSTPAQPSMDASNIFLIFIQTCFEGSPSAQHKLVHSITSLAGHADPGKSLGPLVNMSQQPKLLRYHCVTRTADTVVSSKITTNGRSSTNLPPTPATPRLEYRHIFTHEWCIGLDPRRS